MIHFGLILGNLGLEIEIEGEGERELAATGSSSPVKCVTEGLLLVL